MCKSLSLTSNRRTANHLGSLNDLLNSLSYWLAKTGFILDAYIYTVDIAKVLEKLDFSISRDGDILSTKLPTAKTSRGR